MANKENSGILSQAYLARESGLHPSVINKLAELGVLQKVVRKANGDKDVTIGYLESTLDQFNTAIELKNSEQGLTWEEIARRIKSGDY